MTCFFLDTNVLFRVGFVRDLSRKCVERSHRICVSALVHMERVSQLRREKGDAYDPAAVEAFIHTHGIEIIAFDRDAAEQVAAALSAQFSCDADWQLAKWQRCARAVGQDREPPASPRCPATLDWVIARHALGGDPVIVSDDLGSEFTSVRRVGPVEALEIAMVDGN